MLHASQPPGKLGQPAMSVDLAWPDLGRWWPCRWAAPHRAAPPRR